MPHRVTVRIREHFGVVGEDRRDWHAGESHECSEHFARNLVARGLADIVEAERAITPSVEHRDPMVESRDPGMSSETAAPLVNPRRRGRA